MERTFRMRKSWSVCNLMALACPRTRRFAIIDKLNKELAGEPWRAYRG
jgi:hypothetical protein